MQQEGQGKGALIGTIIVIALLALGGFYFWKQSDTGAPAGQTASDELNAIDAELNAAAAMSANEDLSSLENELQ